MSKIRVTIPDGTPEEQLEMLKGLRKTMLAFAKLAGEEDEIDLSQIDEAIAKLEPRRESAEKE